MSTTRHASHTDLESPPTDQSDRPRSLWRNRDYLLLWSGQALSDIGGAVTDLAFPLLVLAVTHSPAQTGLISALGALPALFVSLPAGVFVDRWDRRRLMLVCDLCRALGLASIVVAYALGVLTIWQLALVALIEGTLQRIFDLAKSAAVAQVVEPAQLTTAIAQDELVEGTTSLFGPSLSGVLFALGAIFPFVADILSYGVSLVTLALIRTPFQQERQSSLPHRKFWHETAEGVRWVWRQPFVLTMTLMMGAGAFVMPGGTLTVILLAERQGASAAVIGLIFACFGVGAILGSVLVARLKRRLTVGRSILIARWYFVASWPLYALAPLPAVLAAIELGNGIVEPIEDVAYFSRRLELIPEALRGRVLSACRLVPGVMRPLGLALTGLVLQSWGVLPTVWLQWGWLLLCTGAITLLPQVRRER
jgi:MFS family permease